MSRTNSESNYDVELNSKSITAQLPEIEEDDGEAPYFGLFFWPTWCIMYLGVNSLFLGMTMSIIFAPYGWPGLKHFNHGWFYSKRDFDGAEPTRSIPMYCVFGMFSFGLIPAMIMMIITLTLVELATFVMVGPIVLIILMSHVVCPCLGGVGKCVRHLSSSFSQCNDFILRLIIWSYLPMWDVSKNVQKSIENELEKECQEFNLPFESKWAEQAFFIIAALFFLFIDIALPISDTITDILFVKQVAATPTPAMFIFLILSGFSCFISFLAHVYLFSRIGWQLKRYPVHEVIVADTPLTVFPNIHIPKYLRPSSLMRFVQLLKMIFGDSLQFATSFFFMLITGFDQTNYRKFVVAGISLTVTFGFFLFKIVYSRVVLKVVWRLVVLVIFSIGLVAVAPIAMSYGLTLGHG